MRKGFIWIMLAVSLAVLAVNVTPANASVETIVVRLNPDFQKSLALNATDGIYGTFLIRNGSADFQLLDTEDLTLFRCSDTDNGTINYVAPRSGNYTLRFIASRSSDDAVLELTYRVRSWHTVVVWTASLETQQGPPWWLLSLAAAIMILILRLMGEILKRLKDRKIVLTKHLMGYKKPMLPVTRKSHRT